MNPYLIRDAKASDIPFIYSTWLKSYKVDSLIGLSVTKTFFYEPYRLVLDYILAQDSTLVLVAHDPNDENVVFGYLVSEPHSKIIHYTFVKESFWEFGIAKALFTEAFKNLDLKTSKISVTHRTKSVEQLMNNKPFLIYNPFLLFKTNSKES